MEVKNLFIFTGKLFCHRCRSIEEHCIVKVGKKPDGIVANVVCLNICCSPNNKIGCQRKIKLAELHDFDENADYFKKDGRNSLGDCSGYFSMV